MNSATEGKPALMVRLDLHHADHGKRRALMDAVLNALRDAPGIDSVSVMRGVAGLNGGHVIHAADILHYDIDLPLLVEFCAAPDQAEAAIARLRALVPAGAIMTWPVMMR
ncbi:MAG: DUF190 domain-containing protein [Acidiphilium sp.]